MYLTLKSQGRKASKDEVYLYCSLINDSLFAFYLPKFSWSIRKREMLNKVYLCDTGFSKLIEIGKETGRKMENMVFLELTRRLTPITEIYFWKNIQQEEVDFIVKEGNKIINLIQVSENVADSKTKEREIRALIKAGKELKCSNLTVITKDYEAEETAEWFGIKAKIKYIPLWRWLLQAD
jgi:hypothetical protein